VGLPSASTFLESLVVQFVFVLMLASIPVLAFGFVHGGVDDVEFWHSRLHLGSGLGSMSWCWWAVAERLAVWRLTFGVTFVLMGAGVESFDPWLGSLEHLPVDGAAGPVAGA